jgi:endonuclease III
MTRFDAKKIIEALIRHYGRTGPELNYRNKYELAISVILSAQTTDKQVNKVTPLLFAQYPSFRELSAAQMKDVETIIRSIGFYKVKSRNIIKAARLVIENFNGELPGTMKELVSIPGIGRKTANVILSQGFGIQAFAVDTHVSRLGRRLGFTVHEDPVKIEKDMTALIDRSQWTDAHLLFIYHGRYTCTARKPHCGKCPIAELCVFDGKNL